MTHILVSVFVYVQVRRLVFHVNAESAHVRDLVLEVAEVDEQVHDRVPDLAKHRLPLPHAHQRTRVV